MADYRAGGGVLIVFFQNEWQSDLADSHMTAETNISDETDDSDRFEVLLRESRKFCKAVGLHDDLILQIFTADSDWSFIIKVDALLEAASKEVVRRSLGLTIGGKEIKSDKLDEFVDALPMSGRASLLSLLEATGCPSEHRHFIEAVRRVRNAYAHNIKNMDIPLFDLITRRSDKSHLLKNLSPISPENYEESSVIQMYTQAEGYKVLRFGIIDETMRFLIIAYHVALK